MFVARQNTSYTMGEWVVHNSLKPNRCKKTQDSHNLSTADAAALRYTKTGSYTGWSHEGLRNYLPFCRRSSQPLFLKRAVTAPDRFKSPMSRKKVSPRTTESGYVIILHDMAPTRVKHGLAGLVVQRVVVKIDFNLPIFWQCFFLQPAFVSSPFVRRSLIEG